MDNPEDNQVAFEITKQNVRQLLKGSHVSISTHDHLP
jgi:hypothetical protein